MDNTEIQIGDLPTSTYDASITFGIKSDLRGRNKSQLKTFLNKLCHDSEYRKRCFHTASVMWQFITLGIVTSMVGAVFPDLRLIIDKDLETASWIFTAAAIGYMIGALSGGYMFDRLNRLLVLATASLLLGVCFSLYPWFTSFPVMLAISFSTGVFSGSINCCGNAHIGSIWGIASAPFFQCIHFGYSVGAFTAPLIAGPFVAAKERINNNSRLEAANSVNASSEYESEYGDTHVMYAFLIAGILAVSAAIPFLIMHCLPNRYKLYVRTPYHVHTNQYTKNDEYAKPRLSGMNKIVFVILITLLISDYACIEFYFPSLLTTFLNEYLDWLPSTSLHVTSLFWGLFAAGRLFCIFVAHFISSETILITHLSALTLTLIVFLFGAMYKLDVLIWASSAVAGLCMSAVAPSVYSWTAKTIVMTGVITSLYMVGCSGLNMIMPLLYGYLMESITQMYFIYLLLGHTCLAICLFACPRCFIKTVTK